MFLINKITFIQLSSIQLYERILQKIMLIMNFQVL